MTAAHRPVALVVGCGYVGSALARLLTPDHDVHGLRRSPDGLPDDVVPLARDVAAPFALPSSPRFDLVFYLVGADGHTPDAYRRAYEDGPANLLAALAAAGQHPRRIVYASSTSVHAQDAGETVDETSATEPTSFSGRSVLAGEHRFADGPIPATRVRFAGIYGPGRAGFVRAVLEGRIRATEPDRFANRIHVEDCARILRFVASASPAPAVVVGADPSTATRNDVIRWVRERAGLSILTEPGAEPAGGPRHGGDKRCRPAWLLAHGYRFRHPDFSDTYAGFVDEWLREQAR